MLKFAVEDGIGLVSGEIEGPCEDKIKNEIRKGVEGIYLQGENEPGRESLIKENPATLLVKFFKKETTIKICKP